MLAAFRRPKTVRKKALSMILLIGGASHTGKTVLAQKLLERCRWPYLSIDHLKMGLIRSGQTSLTPEDDPQLTEYLWPIVREMVKTAVENRQNLIVEGCYIPFDWKDSFGPEYLLHIRCRFLVMTRRYIESHAAAMAAHASDVEERLEDSCDWEALARENEENLAQCRAHECEYILIDGEYAVDWIL